MRRPTPRFESLEDRKLLSVSPVLLQQFSDSDWRVTGPDGQEDRLNMFRGPGLRDDETTVAVGDLNADGVDDVLKQHSDGSFHLEINDGRQLFPLSWGQGPAVEAEFLKLTDVNNDGLNDVVSFDRAQGDIWVSLNSDTGFTSEVWSNFTTRVDWRHMFVDDFDGDGLVDVLGGEDGGGWWLAKNAETTFHNHYWGRLSTFAWENVVSGDFTGDGLPDVAARAADNTWWTWQGTNTQLATPEYWGHWKMGDAWHDVQVADFDADNVDDVIGRTEDGRLWVGTAKTDRFHTWKWGSGWAHAADWSNVSIIDVNGDQLPDQLGRAADNTWWYAENLGKGFANRFLSKHAGPTQISNNFVRSKAVNLSPTFERYSGISGDTAGLLVGSSDVSVSINEEGFLVVTGNDIRVAGLDFNSASGSLVPYRTSHANFVDFEQHPTVDEFEAYMTELRENSDSLFTFFLSNTANQITMANLGTTTLINESVTLDIGWDFSNGARDLQATYGFGAVPVPMEIDDRLDGGSTIAELAGTEVTNRELFQRLLRAL